MFFENTVPLNMRLRMQPRFVIIDKMAGIFTKRIWQPYIRSTWNWAKSRMWLASRGLARPGIDEPSHSVERMEAFCDTNPVQYLHCIIQSDPNSEVLLKCLIQSGLNPKIPLIEHLTGVIKTVWISVSDPVEFFSKCSPLRFRFWIAESSWIAIRKPDHVQHCHPIHVEIWLVFL